MQARAITVPFAVFIAAVSLTPHASAGPCSCNADVTNNGGLIQFGDMAAVADCARDGNCSACVNSCDVDCDGDVDWYDVGVVACAFQGESNCCAEDDGACTGAGGASPPCMVTTDDYCEIQSGSWHGDLTACEGSNVIDIPAASTWGLTAFALSTLIAATLLLQRQEQPRLH